MRDIPTDHDRSQDERDELIAGYQRLVDDAESGVKVSPSALKWAQGRLAELRRASD